MNGQWLEINKDDQSTFSGYLSLPPTGKGPGIILIQEIFGVNEHIQQVADQYAMDGYVVFAPDVFWRQEQKVTLGYDEVSFKKGLELYNHCNMQTARDDLIKAVNFLRQRSEVTHKIASIGYCMGGLLSYMVGAENAVDAAICYYPGGIDQQLSTASEVNLPLLFHFAEKDQYIDDKAVKTVTKTFAKKSNAWVLTYPNVDHGFNCWSRSMYNQEAASLARGRTLEFLSIFLNK
ncbi:MAG: carboxymethylenebutenolidase [Ferrovum sp. 37-45-19]|uniref:dienelactone hydrolase family protein n=1 Tax=Ferrovum sp. JA12 TaxID=1356299 RepID=UPI000702F57F|nr:dienelactone hydrolase family protein [Ferrovum sp. JA12]OYV80324.1 MAG: carboxymethylenebutenolidase [Ferrovum sp. 21-44-67]OYV95069.1 MAG: carboxymethylenebutenolidase [Ferrovum sp. 37-45-19]OZB31793.1 MAG: carboxymethylenebutenolidase [Ferrovum sp. 34-44-207]HQT80870.1 dienelactone hydrolase family protein [Ferrovaceae bacterium]KRH78712.1 carboxymethylenebutenolidase [Ferrovum sp. JA12]